MTITETEILAKNIIDFTNRSLVDLREKSKIYKSTYAQNKQELIDRIIKKSLHMGDSFFSAVFCHVTEINHVDDQRIMNIFKDDYGTKCLYRIYNAIEDDKFDKYYIKMLCYLDHETEIVAGLANTLYHQTDKKDKKIDKTKTDKKADQTKTKDNRNIRDKIRSIIDIWASRNDYVKIAKKVTRSEVFKDVPEYKKNAVYCFLVENKESSLFRVHAALKDEEGYKHIDDSLLEEIFDKEPCDIIASLIYDMLFC